MILIPFFKFRALDPDASAGGGGTVTPAPAADGAAAPAAGSQSAAATTPAPTVTPAAPASQTWDPGAVLSRYLRPPEMPKLTPEQAGKPLTLADLQAHQEQTRQAESVRKFHADMDALARKPSRFGGDLGLTHAFGSERELNDFLQSTKDRLSRGLEASDYLKLDRFDSLIQQAYEKGAKDYEAKLRKGQTTVANPANPVNPVVPAKDTPVAKTATGKVADVGEFLKQQDPEFYDKFMKGEVRFR